MQSLGAQQMSRTLAELVEAYEAALRDYEVYEPQTRDWGGTYDKAGAEKLTRDLAVAEEALLAALEQVGPVIHQGRDYRVPVPGHRAIGSEAGRRLLIGPIARNAAEVFVP
jgi:hypothetical protein